MRVHSLILESISSISYEDKLNITAKMCGAIMLAPNDPEYDEGVFCASFATRATLDHFVDECGNTDFVDDDLDVYIRYIDGDGDEVGMDTYGAIKIYVAFCYIISDLVDYGSYYIDDVDDYHDDSEDNYVENPDQLTEVKRRIKVNAKGVRRIKMQCQKGFKWDAEGRVCKKISGSELATKRKSIRQMIRTKKSMGASLKIRVKRKSNKAKRFRKSMGLKK